jgi:hypothetical protein
MKRIKAILLLLPILVACGCIDYESGVAFNKDLTGKATFKMTMDLAPFVTSMTGAMAARGGGPPPDEMTSMLKSQLATQMGSGMIDVEQLKKNLPAGVTLADSSQKLDDLKIIMNFAFAFTDATKLPLIEQPAPQLAGAGAMAANMASNPLKPFDSFVFTSDDTTMTITEKAKPDATPTADAAAAKAAAQSTMTQAKAQLDQLGMGDIQKNLSIRLAMRFDVPQTVIEQNATRKEGNAYIWEVKIDNVESFDKIPELPGVKLKFKK